MSEFDFDELDKAVAGVIGADGSSKDDTLREASNDSSSVSMTVDESDEPVTLKPAAPAVRRSSGRFMDVVHPSSDMRTRSSSSASLSSKTRNEQPAFTPPVNKTESPDVSSKSTLNSAEGIDDATSQPVGEWSKQNESPFLSDAKVEKRPLGGVAPKPQELLEAPEEDLMLEAHFPDPIDFAAQSATLALESEDTGAPIEDEEVVQVEEDRADISSVAPEDSKSSDEAFEQTIEQLDELEVTGVTTLEDEQPAGPTSITQQYTEKDSTAEQSGSIYDTENYHQALSPAIKKRSGVWTVIWILLLIVLGAGAGVAFYLFVLPML